MMESGNPGTPWNSQNMSFAEGRLLQVAKNLGCVGADQATAVGADAVPCLRAASGEDVWHARGGIGGALLDWCG